MPRATLLTCALIALSAAVTFSQPATAAPKKLTAEQIAEKNVAARGGLQQWRAVQTLSYSGQLEVGGNNLPYIQAPGMPPPPPADKPKEQVKLPFVFELARARKSRFELEFAGKTAVQVYDGKQGWKLRPYLNRLDVEPFSPEELEAAEAKADLDGALVDYEAKGTKIELEGVEPVEGHDAYKLKLTLKDGQVTHEWIDAESFLEVKLEGTPRKLNGKPHDVSVFLRDYRRESGLMIPHVIETVTAGVQRAEKIQIETVTVNPPLDGSRFEKPTAEAAQETIAPAPASAS